MRAPFQTLVIPYYHQPDGTIEYAIFKRSNGVFWQFISGGGEDDETIIQTARRESYEEARIPLESKFTKLDSQVTIPVVGIVSEFKWGKDVYVVPEYSFAVQVKDKNLIISVEHTEYKWTTYKTALNLLKWDSNRNALWELNEKLKTSVKDA